MKKLSVFILILYVVLFCLVGCSNDDGIVRSGFGAGHWQNIEDLGIAGVASQTKAYDRDDFRIMISYGWNERQKEGYLYEDFEYVANSTTKLLVMSRKSFDILREEGYPDGNRDLSTLDNVFEIKSLKAQDFLTDKYYVDIKENLLHITTYNFHHSEEILIPSQILDIDYEMGTDYKGRKEKWATFVIILTLIHKDVNTNESNTHRLSVLEIETKEYEDGKVFIANLRKM